jgi:hypothetical protein
MAEFEKRLPCVIRVDGSVAPGYMIDSCGLDSCGLVGWIHYGQF